MKATEIREKLHNYIDNAHVKKVKAFYTIIENEIEQENVEAADRAFIKELDKRSREMRSASAKDSTLDAAIKRIKRNTATLLKR